MYATINSWLPAPDPNGPVSCSVCGCRLTEADADGTTWRHFSSMHPGRDARGCRPACVDMDHGRDGVAIESSAREPIPFAIEVGMDEPMLGREDVAAA